MQNRGFLKRRKYALLTNAAAMKPGLPCFTMCLQYTREMDMMSHLPDHPNILKLLGACKAPDKLILVMQHCSG